MTSSHLKSSLFLYYYSKILIIDVVFLEVGYHLPLHEVNYSNSTLDFKFELSYIVKACPKTISVWQLLLWVLYFLYKACLLNSRTVRVVNE